MHEQCERFIGRDGCPMSMRRGCKESGEQRLAETGFSFGSLVDDEAKKEKETTVFLGAKCGLATIVTFIQIVFPDERRCGLFTQAAEQS